MAESIRAAEHLERSPGRKLATMLKEAFDDTAGVQHTAADEAPADNVDYERRVVVGRGVRRCGGGIVAVAVAVVVVFVVVVVVVVVAAAVSVAVAVVAADDVVVVVACVSPPVSSSHAPRLFGGRARLVGTAQAQLIVFKIGWQCV